MFNILDVVFDSDYNIHEKIRYLEACNHLGAFGDESSKDTENAGKKIKALLSIPTLTTDGLLLLHTLLPQCSSKMFVDNCESWTRYLLKIVKEKERVVNKHLALRILCSLIPYLKSFPQLWKNSALSLVPSLIESILHLTPEDEWLPDSLEVLSLCMLHFPTSCGAFKHAIEQFLVQHIDFWSGKMLENVATCVAYLPSCGSGGTGGVNYSASWSEQVNNIVVCLNQLLDFLYEGVEISDDSPAIMLSSVELPPLRSTDPVRALFSAWQRCELLSICLMKMLSTQFPVAVNVPDKAILEYACRVLSKNSVMMAKKTSLDCAALASIIPPLHCITFTVLDGLMISCHKLLLVHGGAINKLFVNALAWTRDESYRGTSRPFSMLRVAVYQSLVLWLQLMGRSCRLDRHADVLIPQILADITPETDSVQVRSRFSTHFDKQKTKVKQKHSVLSHEEQTFRKINLASCQDTCRHALKVLKQFLYTSGGNLAADFHKQIHGVVVQQLFDLRIGRSLSSSPYSSPKCQKELYAVLLACILHPHPHWPPPLQAAIQLFSMGQDDTNVQVSSFCVRALAVCTAVIHPRVAILEYRVHSVSPAQSPSVVSEVESHVSILEQPSHSQEESISQPTVLRQSPQDRKRIDAKHLQALLPSQADIVMLSENESEHYSDEDRDGLEDTTNHGHDNPADYDVVVQNENQLTDENNADGKSSTRVLEQALLTKETMITEKTDTPLTSRHDTLPPKQFTNSGSEECDVSEDDAEMIDTEEDEGDYEDEDEDAVDADEEEEDIEEDVMEDEEYLEEGLADSVSKHLQSLNKSRSESSDSNGIHVSSTTSKYSEVVLPTNAISEMDVSHEECEIVESEDNEEASVEHSVALAECQTPETITCTLVDISESPEKGKDLQIGGGPDAEEHFAKLTALENSQEKVETSPYFAVMQENHGDDHLVAPTEEIPAETVAPSVEDVHKVMEHMISSISLVEEVPNTKPVLPGNVVDVNGCDSTHYVPEGSSYDATLRTQYNSENATFRVVEDGVESQVILETVEASSSTRDNTDEPHFKKLRTEEENEEPELPSSAAIGSFVGHSPDRN